MKKVILTGDRPTGPLHLGHYVGSLKNRVQLQNEYDEYIIIADMQALTDNFDNPQKVRDNILQVTLDYLAVGLDPKVTTIFIQSLVPQLAELTMYYMNLVTLARLQRNPTVKTEIKDKEMGAKLTVGFLTYPISQVADITAFKADLVPVGEDQLPMIEQTNEIVQTFNRIYGGDVLKETKALISETPRLIGTDGQSKMGKSLGNAIFLSDSSEVLAQKIKTMYTDPKHLRVEDPGVTEGNPVFEYLTVFDSDQAGLEKLKEQYRHGGLGDVQVKKRLLNVLEEFLAPIRKRREEFATDPAEVMKILKAGTARAEDRASKTLTEVRRAMKLDYFAK
ncbi:MAG: tryptophan--tRNA ligase [bacterium]